MADKFWFGFLICLLLTIGVLFAGCSDESTDAVATPVVTSAPAAQFAAGDIVAKTSSGGESQLYVIIKYDSATDEYERAWIYRNNDGTWGHFIDSRTDRSARKIIEKVYPVKVAHVTLSSIPVVALTVAPLQTTAVVVGSEPTVTAISPASGAAGATVSVTITGTNFQTGSSVKLLLPGSPPVTATAVSASSSKIDCTFNLNGLDAGRYNVIILNPDGQTGMLPSGFTVGDAAPIITSVYPTTLELNELSDLVIKGQNFKEGVKVTLFKGTAEIPCISPSVSSGNSISCDIDLNTKRNTAVSTGDWDVKVLNIEGSQSGTWTKKFTITNATSTKSD